MKKSSIKTLHRTLPVRKHVLSLAVIFALVAPSAAHAQVFFQNIFDDAKDVIDALFGILTGLALLAFFWGIAKLIYFAGNETKRQEGKNVMIWGIVALFVLVSIWGIIQFLEDEINLDTSTPIDAPGVTL